MDQQLRLYLIDTLLSLPAAATPAGRDGLLGHALLQLALNRSRENPRTDFELVIDQLLLMSPSQPSLHVVGLINNARSHAQGSLAASALVSILDVMNAAQHSRATSHYQL